jgi:hypothetical protein
MSPQKMSDDFWCHIAIAPADNISDMWFPSSFSSKNMTCGSDGIRDDNYPSKILRVEIFTRYPQVEFHTYIHIHQVLDMYRVFIGSTITYIKIITNRDKETTKT